MDGGPSAEQRRVLVVLLAFAALSLPMAGFVAAAAFTEWEGLRYGLLGAGSVQPGLAVLLLAGGLAVAIGGPDRGREVLSPGVRLAVVAACVAVVGTVGWAGAGLLTNRAFFGFSAIDESTVTLVARLATGVVFVALALGAGAVGIWTARRPGGTHG